MRTIVTTLRDAQESILNDTGMLIEIVAHVEPEVFETIYRERFGHAPGPVLLSFDVMDRLRIARKR